MSYKSTCLIKFLDIYTKLQLQIVMPEQRFPYIPLELYLQHEETALLKSEYYNGAVMAMGGNNLSHNQICNRLVAVLLECLDEKGCEVESKDVILYIEEPNYTR